MIIREFYEKFIMQTNDPMETSVSPIPSLIFLEIVLINIYFLFEVRVK